MTETVDMSVNGKIATITISNEQRLNALSRQANRELVKAFEEAHQRPEVWVVVLTATGDRAFCVGRDLKEVREWDGSGSKVPDSQPMRGVERNLFEVVVECSKPVVAGIFGHTLGGGAELALAADIRIAADTLSFGFPEAQRGFGANFASVVLPRLLPLGLSNDLLYTGRRITADEARAFGLVNQVVAAEDLQRATHAYASVLLANAPLTLRRYKAMATATAGMPLATALRLNVEPNVYISEDRREGVAAFLEGRTPNWVAR